MGEEGGGELEAVLKEDRLTTKFKLGVSGCGRGERLFVVRWEEVT